MKIFQKKWVKVLLLLAFCGSLLTSLYLDTATIWSREVALFDLYGEKKIPYQDTVIFKEDVLRWDKENLEELCEKKEEYQSFQKETLTITDYAKTENSESLIPSGNTSMLWEEFLKDQGVEDLDWEKIEDRELEGEVVSTVKAISGAGNFIRISGPDFLTLLEVCPYEQLYDENQIADITEEDLEYYGYKNYDDYSETEGEYNEEAIHESKKALYEDRLKTRLRELLEGCQDCGQEYSWLDEVYEGYWKDRRELRLYEYKDDYILYDGKAGTITGTQMSETQISKIKESDSLYFPLADGLGEMNEEGWLSCITRAFTTSLVQQLYYEFYYKFRLVTDAYDFSLNLAAAEIYKDGNPFLTLGEGREENVCLAVTSKEDIEYLWGKDSSFYKENYELYFYYPEWYLDMPEQSFWEFMYTDCLEHGDRANAAVVFTVITIILGILLLIAFLPPLWRREEKKLRDNVLIEVNFLFTSAVIVGCVLGICGICILVREVFLPLFDAEKVVFGAVIIGGLLALLGVAAFYQFLSTIIYRFRKHCFLKGWLAGRFLSWVHRKIKAAAEHMDILKRRILCLAVVWVASFIAMLVLCICAGSYYGFVGVFGMFCYIIFMIAFSFVFLKDAIDNKRLLDGCNRMKDGVFEKKIETDNLYFDKLELAEAINTMGEGLEKAVQTSMKDERMKTELITNVSHDIKTPLTSIINYVDLLKREGVTPEEQKEYLRVLDVKSQRLKQLIEDLVEVSKSSTGAIELQLENLDFKELLNQALGEFQEKFMERSLELVVSSVEHKVQIWADGRRCYRILENLFENVYKYAMPNTRVYVDLQQEVKQMVFTVKNISEAPLNIPVEELMERFVRGDVSRSTSGSGLGLSITENLVNLQQGKMEIKLDGDLFKVEIRFPML